MNIKKILHPLLQESFTENIYEKYWRAFEKVKTDVSKVFSFEELESYLFSTRPWDSNKEELRCAKFPEKSFNSDVNSVEDVIELYSKGYTIILNSAHLRNEEIAKLCAKLSDEFFCCVQANVYVTPANSQSSDICIDTHDIYVLQTVGQNKWIIEEDENNPLIIVGDQFKREYAFDNPKESIINEKEITQKAGESIYIPRGVAYKAVGSRDSPSIHITFSFYPVTWDKLINACILDGSIQDQELMRAIPREILEDLDSPEAKLQIKEKMKKAISNADMLSTWRFLYDRDNVLIPGNSVNSILNIAQLSQDSFITLKKCANVFLAKKKNGYWVSFSGKRYDIPENSLAYFEYISSCTKFQVSDLPGDELFTSSKITFSKWLIERGLAFLIVNQ